MRLRVVAASALASLAVAAPAEAVNQSPAATITTKPAATSDRSKSCNASDKSAGKNLIGSKKGTAVVACEQPPKSQQQIPGLSKATASAIAILG